MALLHSCVQFNTALPSIQTKSYRNVGGNYLAIDNLVNCHRSVHITAITGLAARCCSRWRDTGCNIFAEVKLFLKKGIPFLSTLHVFINLQLANMTVILQGI
jgi:hypothetical protein